MATSRTAPTSATYLDAIVRHHEARSAADGRSLDELLEAASRSPIPPRGFAAALAAPPGGGRRLHVVAEVKRRSPSKGALAADLDPATLAIAYAEGGASCLSVLTDEPHFGGSPADLALARAAVAIPVLRKDFTVDVRDVADARLMGADCCLLIAAVLDDVRLAECLAAAAALGLDALVEVHDEREAERAAAAGATLVGINQRDLVTFAVDTDRAVRVAASLPSGIVAVAESGVDGPAAAARLADAGYAAILVGELLVRSGDPAALVAALGEAAP